MQLEQNHTIFAIMRSKSASYLYLAVVALLLVCSVLQFHHHGADGSLHLLDGYTSLCISHTPSEEGNSLNFLCHGCSHGDSNHHAGKHHCHCCCTLQLSFMDEVQLEHWVDSDNGLCADLSSLIYTQAGQDCVSDKPTTSIQVEELSGWGTIRLLRAPPMYC